MARKIMVSQSTSGDAPESGLDVLNQDGDSVEVALARQLVCGTSLLHFNGSFGTVLFGASRR
jgi:hypothetical protein